MKTCDSHFKSCFQTRYTGHDQSPKPWHLLNIQAPHISNLANDPRKPYTIDALIKNVAFGYNLEKQLYWSMKPYGGN